MTGRPNFKLWLVIAVLFSGIAETTSAEKIIYVDRNAHGNNDGSSWARAYKHLQDALNVAVSGDEIRVAEGIYKPDESSSNPNGNGNPAAVFRLKNGVAIRGGFAGYGEEDPNERDIKEYITVLSGDLNGDDVGFKNVGDNSHRVLIGSQTNRTAILDGFTIEGGYGLLGTSVSDVGGGMYIESGDPTILNCVFNRNSSVSGGGMFNKYSNPLLANCIFEGNVARNNTGGGIHNYRCSPILINCIFIENRGNLFGGGLYFSGSACKPSIENCLFVGNIAYRGGGIDLYQGPIATITNCTFSRNEARRKSYGSGKGGGINIESGGSPTLINCVLWGNEDSYGTGENSQIRGGTPKVDFSCIQGLSTLGGIGNIGDNPLFVDVINNDYHLRSDSPCIDAGDPTSYFGLEPEPDGGRINMGAYGNTPEATCKYGLTLQSYNLVSKTRFGRTTFEYIYSMTLNNNSDEDVSNVIVELLDAPNNVTILDPVVSFAYIAAGGPAVSDDTFSIIVDRAIPVDATIISWRATFDTAGGGGTGQTMFTTAIILDENPSDIIGDGDVDFEDLAELVERWLWVGPAGSIPEDISKDGIVNFADFALLAENWGM